VTAFWDCICLRTRLLEQTEPVRGRYPRPHVGGSVFNAAMVLFQMVVQVAVGAMAVGWTRDALDLPDLSGERDDVCGVPDELERGRPVQTVRDDSKGAVAVDLHERARVRQRRSSRRAAGREVALRQGVQTATAAKFHVNEEGAPEAISVAVGEFGPNDTTLPFSGRWGTGPASAMYTVLPLTSSPVGTMLSNAINTVISPSSVTRSTRLRCPSVTRKPPR
jgi:hypothetical protein